VHVDQNGVTVTAEDGKASSDASVGDNQTIIIKNSVKSYELPTTGGAGTTMIYVAGGVLVAVAVVMFVIQKRKRS
ncbi:LPXTG cell wall anchor domain-containing protein, partial [Lactimicrobium sp.]